jgi:hypothetical protein
MKSAIVFVASVLVLGQQNVGRPATAPNSPEGAKIEQRAQGEGPTPEILARFDGLGAGFIGPHGTSTGGNPSDNSLAVGPHHIVQTVNSKFAIFTKKGAKFETTGRVLYGAVNTNTLFAGFGGTCEARNNGDAVVRYDQLANRWLFVMASCCCAITPRTPSPAPTAPLGCRLTNCSATSPMISAPRR